MSPSGKVGLDKLLGESSVDDTAVHVHPQPTTSNHHPAPDPAFCYPSLLGRLQRSRLVRHATKFLHGTWRDICHYTQLQALTVATNATFAPFAQRCDTYRDNC